MAYDGWIEYNGIDLINMARTAKLADTQSVDVVWTRSEDLSWVQGVLADSDYSTVTNAPWYDVNYLPSGEFIGALALSVQGLEDSSYTSEPVEYINAGGSPGKGRDATKSFVFSVALIGSTERGVEYGLRWLKKVLRGSMAAPSCSGATLRAFRYGAADSPTFHYNDVSMVRSPSITRKRSDDCSTTWLVTFTLNAADPYEYGDAVLALALPDQDIAHVAGPRYISGTKSAIVLTQSSCPAYDYSPIYDPLYPAAISSPSVPNFYPDGWDIYPGMTFDRLAARITPLAPSKLMTVPLIKLRCPVAARFIRISIWPSDSPITDQCDPLFTTIVSYLPPNNDFYIDGEQRTAYIWDGSSAVRRTDSLIYGTDAVPVDWTAFNDPTNLLVTCDAFVDSDGLEGGGLVQVTLSLIPKSD